MIAKWLVVLAIILVAVMLLGLLVRKTVHAETTIQAKPEDVWAVLTNSSSYPEWNPIFVSMDGEFNVGEALVIGMKSPDSSIIELKPRIKRIAPNRHLNMLGGIPGVMTFDHRWTLEAVDGGTRVIQHEEFRGIGMLLWNPAWVEDAYEQANANLKAILE